MVSTLVLSTVGLYTSDSTPPATVNHTLDARLLAVPTQSLRARSKWDKVPGPSVATVAAWAAPATVPRPIAAISSTTMPRRRARPGPVLRVLRRDIAYP